MNKTSLLVPLLVVGAACGGGSGDGFDEAAQRWWDQHPNKITVCLLIAEVPAGVALSDVLTDDDNAMIDLMFADGSIEQFEDTPEHRQTVIDLWTETCNE